MPSTADKSLAIAEVRNTPLSGDELLRFYTDGFLRLGRILDDDRVGRLCDVIAARRDDRRDDVDLLDPALWPDADGGVPQEPGRNVSFLFNLWREEPEFAALVTDARFAGWAAQVLGATAVRVLEDNALTKDARSGGELRWHQDYSYWPLGQPNAVTIWIALDDVTVDNGAMRMARGSHLLGERLPAVFGTGASYFRGPSACRRPTDRRPRGDAGLPVDVMELQPARRRCTTRSRGTPPVPTRRTSPRRAAVVRYVADGTTWFGATRYEFNYTDDEVGLDARRPDRRPVLPARRRRRSP